MVIITESYNSPGWKGLWRTIWSKLLWEREPRGGYVAACTPITWKTQGVSTSPHSWGSWMLFVTCSFQIDLGSNHPTLQYIWETRNAEKWQWLANIKMSMERNQVLMLWPGHTDVLIKLTNKSAFSWSFQLEVTLILKSLLYFYLLNYYEEEVGHSWVIPSGIP